MSGEASQRAIGPGYSMRAPTVEEAFQYTPLTSIIPFSTDLIPYPSTDSNALSPLTGPSGIIAASRSTFEAISSEASTTPTSVRLQRSLGELRNLLHDKELTNFEFIRPKVITQVAQRSSRAQCRPSLCRFAEVLLDNTSVDFRYPTPISPVRDFNQAANATIPDIVSVREISSTQRSPVLQEAPTATLPSVQVPSDTSDVPAVVIPSPDFQSSRYQEFPDIDAQVLTGVGLSKKRENGQNISRPDNVTQNFDVRAQSDETLAKLQELLLDVLDAEEQVAVGEREQPSIHSSAYFEHDNDQESSRPLITQQTISKLLSYTKNVALQGRFAEVSVDHLVRIQKLCDHAVQTMGSIRLKVHEEWDESDVQDWVGRVQVAESRLYAIRLLIFIMTPGSDEKQLSSEDFVTNAMDAIKHVFDTCIIAAVETRASGESPHAFKIMSKHKKALGTLFKTCGRALSSLGGLLAETNLSESCVARMEFLCKDIIFAESGNSEKDSAVGMQRIETLKLAATDALVKIFTRCPGQRQSILQDVLTSLGKLTTARQTARQFKLDNGKPIQLVSALLMRLIQTCATPNMDKSIASLQGAVGENGTSIDLLSSQQPLSMEDIAGVDSTRLLLGLKTSVRGFAESVLQSADFVVGFLIHRAQNATKSGETPYRNLLDLFTEDFLNVLGLPEWPGAEVLLHQMFQHMQRILQENTSTVKAKNMALELLGKMAVGIFELQSSAQSSTKSIDTSSSNLSAKLLQYVEAALEEGPPDMDSVDLEGVFRMTVEHLSRSSKGNAHTLAARSLLTVQWVRSTLYLLEANGEPENDDLDTSRQLLLQLRNTLVDPDWLQHEFEFESISDIQGCLASATVTLNLGLCRNLETIIRLILVNLTSEHAHLKARSLNCVEQLLKSSPDLLKRYDVLVFQILRCCGDPKSSQARGEALRVLGSCLKINPRLDSSSYQRIIPRLDDEYVSVRKQTLQLLKDMYLRNSNDVEMRTTIACALLQKSNDHDESVANSVRQLFEEIWMQPFYAAVRSEDAQLRVAMHQQIMLIVKVAQSSERTLTVLEALFSDLLTSRAKQPAQNSKVCKALVNALFESLIDADENDESMNPRLSLQAMAVFAKAEPTLFTAQQLERLEPYIQALASPEDAAIFKLSVVIFRNVFPSLSSVQKTLLERVQAKLFENMTKLGQNELTEVWPCLWAIYGELKNENRILRLTTSVLSKIRTINKDITNDQAASKEIPKGKIQSLQRLLLIAGNIGKACNLELFVDTFRRVMEDRSITSVSNLMVDYMIPLANQIYPTGLRKTALESVGMICQASPEQFLRKEVHKAYELVFRSDELYLQQVVITTFKSFFALAEKRSESGADIKVGEGGIHGSERLGKSLVATDSDSAAAGIAQQFLKPVLRVALSDQDELALAATEVLTSISRQGLVHPRECGSALIALETSPNALIAELAFKEHRSVHEKHETMFEKEYIKAVEQAFAYQKNVYGTPGGLHLHPPTAKLQATYSVLDKGGARVRKRFLTNLAHRCSTAITKANGVSGDEIDRIELVRFLVENAAFFDYTRNDDLLVLATSLEKVVATAGTSTAHAIETDILKVRIESTNGLEAPQSGYLELNIDNANPQADLVLEQQETITNPPSIEPEHLKRLATSSAGFLMVWETAKHLRKMWNVGKQGNATTTASTGGEGRTKAKPAPRDISRPATKKQGYNADEYIRLIAGFFNGLASREAEAQMVICHAFAKIMSEDSEHRIADDGNEDDNPNASNGYETPTEYDGAQVRVTPSNSRDRKRKGSAGSANAPKRPKLQKTPSRRSGNGMKRTVSFASTNYNDDDDGDGDYDKDYDNDGDWA